MMFGGTQPTPGAQTSLLNAFPFALSQLERGVTRALGVDDILQYATSRPAQLGFQNDDRGEGDAMRHLLLSAELYRTHPNLAGPLLWGHENVTNVLQREPDEDYVQDTFNNKLGKWIGNRAKSRAEVEQMAQDMMRLKRPMVLPPPPRHDTRAPQPAPQPATQSPQTDLRYHAPTDTIRLGGATYPRAQAVPDLGPMFNALQVRQGAENALQRRYGPLQGGR